MTTPARADRDRPCRSKTTFDYVADFANSQEWDPGVATAERLDDGPVGVGTSLPARGAAWAAGSRRWSTGSPSSSRRPGSSSSARAPASPPSTTSGSSASRPARGSTTRPTSGSAGSSVSSSRSSGGAFATHRPERRRRHAADARRRAAADGRPPRSTGGRGMKVAIVGAGVSGLTAAYALRRDHEIRLFDARCGRRRPRQDGRGRDRPGPDRGRHGLHRLQRAHLPDSSSGCSASSGVETQPSDMSLGSTCRACDVEFSSRGVRGYLATAGAAVRPGHWRMMADILRFYRDARATLDATGAVRGDPRRLPRRRWLRAGLPAPFPRADHVRGLVDGEPTGSSTSRSTTCSASSTTTG